VLEAIDELIRENVDLAELISVEWYGTTRQNLMKHAVGLHIANVLKCEEWVGTSECRAIQRSADMLLLLGSSNVKGMITSKVFTYLAAQRPILCMPAGDGCIDQLLSATGAGVAFATKHDIKQYIFQCFCEWKAKGGIQYHGKPAVIANHSCLSFVKRIVRTLDFITE